MSSLCLWCIPVVGACMQQINRAQTIERENRENPPHSCHLLTSSHFINLVPVLRLSGTDTGLSCSAWTPGCAPAIDSSAPLDARAAVEMSHFSSPSSCSSPSSSSLSSTLYLSSSPCCDLLRSRRTEAHNCCCQDMSCPHWRRRRRWRVSALESGGGGGGGGRRRSSRPGATDWLTERHAAKAKKSGKRRRSGGGLNE